MKKKTKARVVAVVTAVCLLLGGCARSSADTNTTAAGSTAGTTAAGTKEQEGASKAQESEGKKKPIKDLMAYQTIQNEMETFNVLYSQSSKELYVLSNCVEGLLSNNEYGELVPGLAESWGSDDNGLTWTFHLRKGVKWVDMNGNPMADCTAQDFITSLEFILNFYKNSSANTSMPIELIKGAGEYYEYTKSLTEAEALALDRSKFLEMVGIAAPDDYTIVYTCTAPKPYFASVGTYNCLFPAPKALIDQLGPAGYQAMTNKEMWYNGCYTITSYVQGNEKVLTKNPLYWNQDCTLFDTVTVKMVESHDVAYQMYQSGELDYVTLSESNLKTIYDSPNNPYHDQLVEKRPTLFSYQFHLNYNKYKEDGTPDTNWNKAIANKAFRLAWYYGLDLTEYYKRTNGITPLKCENNAYTMQGLVHLSDGTDYTKLVTDKLGIGSYNGETMVRLDKAKGDSYKEQAIKELTAAGVTFPVEADYYIAASDQTALDTAAVLKQSFTDSFGDDFIKMNIKTYVSSLAKEVRDPKLQSFTLGGWGADYGDPQSYLSQEVWGQDNAFYTKYSNINDLEEGELLDTFKEYTAMVDAANQISDDLDKRYKAYAEAEAFLIENALVIPCYYNIQWQLTHINDYTRINAMFGCQNEVYRNWETSVDGYTGEQYEEFIKRFEEGKAK